MEQKRLLRSKSDSVIAGVCGGLGEYFDTDPIIFRILFVLAILFGGGGLLVYIILWIAVPEEKSTIFNTYKTNNMETENTKNENFDNETIYNRDEKVPKPHKSNNDGNIWGGLILITLGVLFLIDRFVPNIDFGDMWPVILIAIGAILIMKSYKNQK
jgi:phage shock protein PspC (stress-responsive transcriptional regulator)